MEKTKDHGKNIMDNMIKDPLMLFLNKDKSGYSDVIDEWEEVSRLEVDMDKGIGGFWDFVTSLGLLSEFKMLFIWLRILVPKISFLSSFTYSNK